MQRYLVFCFLFVLSAIGAPDSPAQIPVSVEASFGWGTGTGGTYTNRGAPQLDLTLGLRVADTPAGRIVGGLTVGVPLPVARTLECLLLANGECAPHFPQFFSGGALLGMQWGSARSASLRALAGPVYYRALEGSGAVGFQGRLDLATPPLMHTALIAPVQSSVLPSFQGNTLGITSAALGLRFQ